MSPRTSSNGSNFFSLSFADLLQSTLRFPVLKKRFIKVCFFEINGNFFVVLLVKKFLISFLFYF